MRVRYTFEIVTLGLLMAAGSILRPAPASACHTQSAVRGSLLSARNLILPGGGRG